MHNSQVNGNPHPQVRWSTGDSGGSVPYFYLTGGTAVPGKCGDFFQKKIFTVDFESNLLFAELIKEITKMQSLIFTFAMVLLVIQIIILQVFYGNVTETFLVPFREIPIALRNWYFPERNGTTIFNIGWTESQSPRYSPGPAGGRGAWLQMTGA